jgi:hypothetical protein
VTTEENLSTLRTERDSALNRICALEELLKHAYARIGQVSAIVGAVDRWNAEAAAECSLILGEITANNLSGHPACQHEAEMAQLREELEELRDQFAITMSPVAA